MSICPESWPLEILSTFCSQYGSPDDYPVVIRARLLGTFGAIVRVADMLHQTVLQSSVKVEPKNKREGFPLWFDYGDKANAKPSDGELDELREFAANGGNFE